MVHVDCRFPRKRRRLICCGLMLAWIVLMGAGVLFVHTMGSEPCSDQDSKRAIEQLCEMYREEKAAGNLCQDLCIREKILYQKCMNYKHGKTVLGLLWAGKPIIFKTKHVDLSELFTLAATLGFEKETEDKVVYPDFDKFRTMLTSNLKRSHGYKPRKGDKVQLSEIWSLDPEKYLLSEPNKKKAKAAAMNSIWNLLQQDEYVFMALHQNWEHTPRIYGTCGHFYAVEFVPPNESLERHIFGGGKSTWKERVSVAISILDLVHDMDSQFPMTLHMCDVKLENFAVSSAGLAKLIDMDMVFDEQRMKSEIMNIDDCTSHDQCIFFDCKGRCDMTTRKCQRTPINNNLQSVCEKVFLDTFSNAFTGLLRKPPPEIQSELEPVLRECSNPQNSQDSRIRWKASSKLYHQLYDILKRSIV